MHAADYQGPAEQRLRVQVAVVVMMHGGVCLAGIRVWVDVIGVRMSMKVPPAVAVVVDMKVHPPLPEAGATGSK